MKYNVVNFGPTLDSFEQAYKETGKKVDFLVVAGYNTGLIIEKTLDAAKSFDQLEFRKALAGFSGKVKTLDGEFKIDASGAQVGEMLPVAQFVPPGADGLDMHIVYPANLKTGNEIYPAP